MDHPTPPNRVIVLGCSGSGKSTLSSFLSQEYDLPFISLDQHYFSPNWKETPEAAWRKKIQSLISTDRWVMDGNYASSWDLIAAIKKSPDHFGQVYDAHYSVIFNYCFKRTKDFNVSKDIVSETFLKAFINIKHFKWRGISIRSWLYRIAINEIKLHYRAKKYRPFHFCL